MRKIASTLLLALISFSFISKIGIGTPYSNNNIFSERSKEMVLDSSFVRSIVSHKEILKDFNLSKALFRPLFSLALLESHYELRL